MRKLLTVYRLIFAGVLCLVVAIFMYHLQTGKWLQTDLHTLLPDSQHYTKIQLEADKHQEQQFNQQVIALVGHSQSEAAFTLAEKVAEQWQQSGLFQTLSVKNQPNLTELQQQIELLKLATLPISTRNQIIQQPERYFQQYAEQIINPFSHQNLLPLEQDWLGFGRFVLSQSQQQSQIQWHAETGMLYAVQQGKTWVLLTGKIVDSDLIKPQQNLTALLKQNAQFIQEQQGQWLSTGAVIFADYSQQQAKYESTIMGGLGISLTLLLLLLVFRSLRILWLFLPISVGMVAGITATISCFGQIHILTLVIGTSLVGVLIDFPLHWLTSSLFLRRWNGNQAMAKLRLTFFVSLLVTLLGYALLGFTALPILKQTALFSGMALIFAVLTTFLYLPLFFRHYQSGKSLFLRRILQINFHVKINSLLNKILFVVSTGFIVVGLQKSYWQDDIRQWVAMPTELIEQAQKIRQITGIDLSNQYLLITAENNEQLLQKDQILTEKLQRFAQENNLIKFQSLSQWIMSKKQQAEFIQQLKNIPAESYSVFDEIGIPKDMIRHSLKKLEKQPIVSLEQALNTELGKVWKNLYLGELDRGKVASIIKVSGLNNPKILEQIVNNRDIYWQDKPAHLNQLFEQTRNQAAWLKLLSFGLAALLLWRMFGISQTLKMLSIPLISVVCTVAILGWLNITISLFAMFGLLLVSVIGIDYIAYMQTAKEPLSIKRFTISLAALTTLISFALLGLSSTPAVASFGLSVSLGVLISLGMILRIK